MRLGKGVERTIDMKDEMAAVPEKAPEKPQEKAPEEAPDTEEDVALPLEPEEAAEPEPVG
jgi:hypothetical protein